MSTYAAFDVVDVDTNGIQTLVGPTISVKVRKAGAGSDAAESPLTTDSLGHIPSGTLAGITAGSTVYFRVENYNGKGATLAQVTT